jgi:hypothetical protein
MLESLDPREVQVAGRDCRLFLGQGPLALEVLAAPFPERPRITELRDLFKNRLGGRAAPVLVVGTWGNGRAAVCGPTQHNPIEHLDLALEQVEAVCRRALELRDRHQAIRVLHQLLPQLDAPVPGLRNGGLFAMQELEHGVPERKDWQEAVRRSKDLRRLRGRDLIQALNFVTEEMPGPGLLLLAEDRKTAVAVLLDHPEEIDAASDRFDGVSPVSFALARADREHLDYVMVLAGSTVRVYPARPGVGSGRRGRSETFVELNLDLLPAESAGYLWLLFSAEALRDGGTFVEILERSEDYAAKLGSELRERVYQEVIPRLSRAAVQALSPDEPDQEELTRAYEVALRILYRLLFVAYGEDQDLLPLHTSKAYREHSLKRMAQRLAEAREKGVEFGREDFYWTQVSQIWKAVSRGNREWDVPAYNGTLFAPDRETSPLGALIEGLSIPDEEFAPALAGLLLDRTPEGVEGPVDFRSLGVREFGTIYEGLLESELSLAETDLTVDPRTDAYLPAGPEDEVEVRAGEVYLHNRSGARKSTGSYYTKSFAVEHLLDRSLEPALDEHFQRLSEMTDRQAGRGFFEFRVADIAMGSGHFLVAAIDRIERRFVSYLAERPLPDVKQELERLRRAAMENLGKDWAGDPIEDAQLLRRQVARRCIFGVDLNPMAVELARLSIWIHTFVPGLPLSLLDQNLVQGNSLVGIATFDEASELIQAETGDLFSFVASERLKAVREPLEKLGKLTDLNDAEIREARALYASMREATKVDADLFTILTASRTSAELHQALAQGQVATQPERQGDAFQASLVRKAEKELEGLDVLHFPLAFPHVFLGSRRGFDVILGNPPWEKPRIEEHGFWARHFPGFRALPQRQQEELRSRYRQQRPDLVKRLEEEKKATEALRRLLTAGAYPGMGTGDPDLYKAFVWRFWHLVSPSGGRIGVVLPRSALTAKGSSDFRKAMLEAAEVVDLTMILNSSRWAFDMEPRYTIGLTAIARRDDGEESELRLSGPYASLEAFGAAKVREPAVFPGSEVSSWNDTASLPLLPSDASVQVFAQLRESPRLDLDDGRTWRARPHTDLHATNDKRIMNLESEDRPPGAWPVYKGESFDLWEPDRGPGSYYAWGDPEVVLPHLQAKRQRAGKRSAFADFDPPWREDPETLPCKAPRIAFRDVTRATDSRTVRAALIPPKVVLVHTAPHFLFPRGDEQDVAFLLGVLSSIPLDWYARRFVETHLTYFTINPFPVPRPDRDDARWNRVVALAGRLAGPDDRFSDWATKVGVEHGPLSDDQKEDHIHELDAVVAHLYGLSEPQLIHIFETFHEGWDYEDRLQATLNHFRDWKGRR